MTGRLDGRVALVTGSSRGIGRGIARRLAAEGATVVVTARSMTPSASIRDGREQVIGGSLAETVDLITAAGGRALAIPADLEDPAQRDGLVDAVIEQAGALDILVNNAGFADYSPIETMGIDTFERTVEHYLRVPFLLTQKALPHMRAAGRGWIVNIGSSTGLPPIRPFREYNKTSGDVVYASVKAALHRFTQGLAAEVMDDGICVNAVGPSTAIRTPGADDLLPEGYEAEPVEYLAQTVLEMCTGSPAERTGLVTFSLHYPWSQEVPVYDLAGTTELPRLEPPQWCNPHIAPAGIDRWRR
ncbi:SDR family NAD(P)-dependent oxidoreductase [Dietzia sp. B32]|uniref:SDR family NAD(P)-dependent oxidoreductase n=1 Tax=Dietzia sp. B32 TaxID=2915130 RepID=UPI0021ADDB78|nr:SDR family NAD(P)-dependent oxidoreductase [Dietzia sp. B32]UVE94200.1 SDR family NAD(P)-dependent oxidoreductase [Dietzia sp. B32]